MALVNVFGYYNMPSSTNVPWTIHQLEDGRMTLKQLYELVTQNREKRCGIEARIGKAKESLDSVNSLGLVKNILFYNILLFTVKQIDLLYDNTKALRGF